MKRGLTIFFILLVGFACLFAPHLLEAADATATILWQGGQGIFTTNINFYVANLGEPKSLRVTPEPNYRFKGPVTAVVIAGGSGITVAPPNVTHPSQADFTITLVGPAKQGTVQVKGKIEPIPAGGGGGAGATPDREFDVSVFKKWARILFTQPTTITNVFCAGSTNNLATKVWLGNAAPASSVTSFSLSPTTLGQFTITNVNTGGSGTATTKFIANTNGVVSGMIIATASNLTHTVGGQTFKSPPNFSTSTNRVVIIPKLEAVQDVNNNHQVDPADTELSYVRFGLWDDAFNAAGTAVRNGQAEVDNFVGSDRRRFYFRITNPSANQNPGAVETINLQWFTTKANGSDDDRPQSHVTLTETGVNTGIFVSRAVMLVADNIDRAQPTATGLPAGGISGPNQNNHRLRRAEVDGFLKMRYLVGGSTANICLKTIPIFNRSTVAAAPDRIRPMTIHIFNFRGGSPNRAAIGNSVITAAMENTRGRYAIAGVKVNFIYTGTPTSDIVQVPSGSGIDLNDVAEFTRPVFDLIPSAGQTELINLFRARDPAGPGNANTAYMLFIGRFRNMDRGESFPDGFNSPATARNVVFIAGRAPLIRFVPPHEIGHLLLNQTAADTTDGGHYAGAQFPQNLMPIDVVQTDSVRDSKRLWDDIAVHTNQITRLRTSRFIAP